MSDSTPNEADGVGAADPITGVTGAKDDLDRDLQLPDSDEDLDAAVEEDVEGQADAASMNYVAADPEAELAASGQIVTNDAVAGETVDAGRGDGNDGPTGGAPGEIQPDLPENDLDPSVDLDARPIDLDDEA